MLLLALLVAVAVSVPIIRTLASPVRTYVQFSIRVPSAETVTVMGDFNAWSPTAHPLVKRENSTIWEAWVPLPPGRHRYRYQVDGKRFIVDGDRLAVSQTVHGGAVSVVFVPAGGKGGPESYQPVGGTGLPMSVEVDQPEVPAHDGE